MQFQHPEVLFALFLLLIPIFIHLFQLRRFQKVDFTNVAFLKKVTIQTRKSSQLKKWLTLLMRLLALACIILAFAQPFTASETALDTNKETVIYIDNSFSLEAKGTNGPLLKRALQQLFEALDGDTPISWFTNNQSKSNSAQSDFKGEVLAIPYTHQQLGMDEVLLKAQQLFSDAPGTSRRLILVSDFQQQESLPERTDSLDIDAVWLRPVNPTNVNIDSAFVGFKNTTTKELTVRVSAEGDELQQVPISLFGDGTLLAKTAVDFTEGSPQELTFDIENTSGFEGRLQITDPGLSYDNHLYFSLNDPEPIKVMSINEADASFLRRLFDQPNYTYNQFPASQVDYNIIAEQNLIILNEVVNLPASLRNALVAYQQNGGSFFVIPAMEANLTDYNNLLGALGLGSLEEWIPQERKIAKINFAHPLFDHVFEKEVTNFQFPKVNGFYGSPAAASPVIEFEDNRPFLLQRGTSYLATAPISVNNSNFINSPLIVPTLINMAEQSLPQPDLYFTNGTRQTFAVPITLSQDDILTIKDSVSGFIPLQQSRANSVEITTELQPEKAGNFIITQADNPVQRVSYNYPRTESNLRYVNPEDWLGKEAYESVGELFEEIVSDNKINSFWKWFVIFALVFLLFEMLILKFFK